MNDQAEIFEALDIVAEGLEKLSKPVVFVGGSTVPLYLDPELRIDARPTKDVDIVVEAITWMDYQKIEDELRKFEFKDPLVPGGPRCRRVYKGITVDVMPTADAGMGFSTKWYPEGFTSAVPFKLPSGREIKIFSVGYFILAKLEAVFDRGKDLRMSSDLEDIVTILSGRSSIEKDVAPLSKEIGRSFKRIVGDPAFDEAIYGHAPRRSVRNADGVLALIKGYCES